MRSGKTLWEELVDHYYAGAVAVKNMAKTWSGLKGRLDQELWRHVSMMLDIQYDEALWWRNACVLYFQTFSKMKIPANLEKPDKSLEYYENLHFRYTPNRVDP